MAKHRYTNLVCAGVIVCMLAVTVLFMAGESLGVTAAKAAMPYVERLFSTDRVHTLDIVVDETQWQETVLDNASAKEYINATVVIDGESVTNVGIRTKGNSSLSTMVRSDSDRYSFKVEFDHYVDGRTYYGLDKLALNNIIQDSTYLKDYLCYQMMNAFGAASPLCSFIWVTVNGENFGLYLAVEAVEESMVERYFGDLSGQLYKPDSMDMGGMGAQNENQAQEAGQNRQRGGGGFGMNSSDVALVYTDDDPASYPNIFDSAKFDSTEADQARLIASLRQLGEGENLEEVVSIDEVLRYFVVHNFVLNFDSYTGSMNHNYYLYEDEGQLSMIAWDYNLAFGAFSMGGGMGRGGTTASTGATSMVNFPIDTPTSGANLEDRPLLGQLLADETYLAQYHELFDAFIAEYFESGQFTEEYDAVVALIAPYVEKDPTAFVTYDEFLTATETLREFCLLRAESIRGQLAGTIPATSGGQSADSGALVDASHLSIQAMGSQGGGGDMGGFGGGNMPQDFTPPEGFTMPEGMDFSNMPGMPEDFTPPEGMEGMPAMFGGQGVPPGEDAGQETTGSGDMPTTPDTQNAAPETGAAAGRNRTMPGEGGFAGMGGEPAATATQSDQTAWLLVGVCALVLLLGMLVAWKF